MPSSRPNAIPTVIHLIRQLNPQSILDVGVGFGKWGHLFREYTDILAAEKDPARYRRENWRVRIDGIEGHSAYLTDMHRFLYNEVYVGDAGELIGTLPKYDVIFAGDIIEHFEKRAGEKFLREALAHAAKAVIVSTPKFDTGQTDLCGNELERHRSLWSARDFRRLGKTLVETVDGGILLAVLLQPDIPPPVCGPAIEWTQTETKRWLRKLNQDLVGAVAPGDKFIFVDDEQLRGSLELQASAIPFLEKNGEYWGAPADDEAAIRELTRLKDAGATRIVFAWPSYWWLNFYARFHRHLRDNFPCAVENERLMVFDLR
jgi:hypothetical protein